LSIALLEDGRLLEVNAAFLRMTGFGREEVIGRTTVELGLWAGHPRRAMGEVLHERGAVENLEIKFLKKSGEIRDGLLSAELIHLGAVPSVLGIAQDVTERKRAEETLRSYSRRLIEAQEAERQHIARELHDQIGQVLTAIRINLQTIGNLCETAESRPLIDQGVAIIDVALEQVRDLSFELRPSLLDNLGLVAALRWYSDQYTQRTGIRTKSVTNLPEGQTRLRQELETACFRIVQEALTNVVRHANAKNVSIDLRKLDHKIVLSIKDDGIGFDQFSPNGGASAIRLGLTGMKEHALALGGTLEIESAPAQGTEIRAYFPAESKED
jgi:PAS domain S-box-containing protein